MGDRSKLALALLVGSSLACSPPRDRSRGTPRTGAGVGDAGDRDAGWGWRSGGPRLEYSGPVDAATIGGRNADSPSPLVMGGALGADWFVTLARIDADGSLAENLAGTIYVRRW